MNKPVILLICAVLAVAVVWCAVLLLQGESVPPIRVGILNSLTGTQAETESPTIDATLLAIDEINANGGILGRNIEALIADGCSDWPTYAREAERLITQEEVCVVFGCWTSASRKTAKPVFEKYNHLLVYPILYEGLEESPNIMYTGAAPNQQIIPAVKWCFDHLGKKFFLVGSDYIFPRTANEIIKDQVTALGGEIVGEEYRLLGSADVEGMVRAIAAARPDVILSVLVGETNIPFFRELREAGIAPEQIPVMSFVVAETANRALGIENMVGNYACWNYFQSVDSEANRGFVRRFQAKYGDDRVIDDPMEAGHISVHLWAQAVAEAGTEEVNEVRLAMRDQSFDAPEGLVYVDPENQHLWKTVRIGRVRPDGQFDIVWDSIKPIKPVPYPATRSKAEWDAFLEDLYNGWNQTWANPGN